MYEMPKELYQDCIIDFRLSPKYLDREKHKFFIEINRMGDSIFFVQTKWITDSLEVANNSDVITTKIFATKEDAIVASAIILADHEYYFILDSLEVDMCPVCDKDIYADERNKCKCGFQHFLGQRIDTDEIVEHCHTQIEEARWG
jgi:hypothetical protein